MNSENINTQINSSEEVSLKNLILDFLDLYRYLLSKWMILIALAFVGCICGFMYSHYKKPVYTATTTFVLEDSGTATGTLGGLGGLASMVGIDVGGGGGIFQGDNIIELYKSRKMIQKTLLTWVEYNGKKQLLINKYIEFNKLNAGHSKTESFKELNFENEDKLTRLQDSLLGVIVKDIDKNYLSISKPDKKLSIFKVEMKSNNEFFAKKFNDEIVENVNNFYLQTKTKKSLDNVLILQHKTDSVRAIMNKSIYRAAVVTDATPNLNPTRQIQRMAPVQSSQFSAETNKAVLSELVKNLEMSKISLSKETPLIQVVDQPIFPLTIEKLGHVKGIVLGGLLSSILTIFFLTIRRVYLSIMS